MADFRQIHTSIWDDEWFCQLSSDAKIVFIWLFSNRRAAVSGLYQFTEFICSRETGLPIDNVKNAIKYLIDAKKIYVEGDWVWVKNLRKYNYYKNDNADKRIQKDLDQLPNNGLKKAYIAYYKPLDSPLIAPTTPLLEQEHEKEHDIDILNVKVSSSDSKDEKPQRPNIYSVYEREVGPLTQFICEDLDLVEKEYPDGYFDIAVKEAKRSSTRVTLNYIKKILVRFMAEGLPQSVKPVEAKKNKKTVPIEINGEVKLMEVEDES